MKLTRRRFLGLVGGGIAAGGVYACGIEPLWLETNELELALPRLPVAFDGYRIVQLSDLHVGPAVPRWHLDRAVEAATSFSPDLIVVTGDLVDHLRDASAPALAGDILRSARATDGVVAVTGNHDLGAYHEGDEVDRHAVPRLREALSSADVTLLENEARVVERGGSRLRVAGFGDLWSGRFDRAAVRRGECTIALSHNPDTAPELARTGRADLMLSGHTHGGQIRFPVFGPPWIPLKHKQFLAGHFRLGDTHLYVNRGLGWTHRIRFRARPELTVFTLRARRPAV